MIAYQLIELPTDAELLDERRAAPGNVLRAVRVPPGVRLWVGIDQASEAVELRQGDQIRSCAGKWTDLYVSTTGKATGDAVSLWVATDVELIGATADPVIQATDQDGAVHPVLSDDAGYLLARLADRLREDLDSVTTHLTEIPWIGTHGVPWDAAALAAGDESDPIDCRQVRQVVVMGQADAATDVVVLISQDGARWFELDTIAAAALTDFVRVLDVPARWLRLRTTAAATITATVAGKG